MLVVLSGPSGVGKDAVVSTIRSRNRPYHIAVTATTRPKRAAEVDGVDYIFIGRQDFEHMVEESDLLEWAVVYGNLYGVPKSQVSDALAMGADVIVKTDVQGAATIRKLVPEALLLFLAPPDEPELEARLKQRMTESPEALRIRLATAKEEMKEADRFDYVVVNHSGRLDETVAEIEAVVAAERERKPPRRIVL